MSHSAGYYPIETKVSRTYSRTWTYKIAGVTVDLTGYTATLTIRKQAESPTALLTLTSGSGLTLGGVAGTVTATITGAQATALGVGVYWYDLELVSSGGVSEIDFLEGPVKVKAASTR